MERFLGGLYKISPDQELEGIENYPMWHDSHVSGKHFKVKGRASLRMSGEQRSAAKILILTVRIKVAQVRTGENVKEVQWKALIDIDSNRPK